MPADRAFGRVEKILRTHDTLLLPEEYYNCFSKVGYVRHYDIDWTVYDYKKISDNIMKKQHFKITDATILEVSPSPGNVIVKYFYTAAGCQHSLFKRGKLAKSQN